LYLGYKNEQYLNYQGKLFIVNQAPEPTDSNFFIIFFINFLKYNYFIVIWENIHDSSFRKYFFIFLIIAEFVIIEIISHKVVIRLTVLKKE
jgi:hypothetical protein